MLVQIRTLDTLMLFAKTKQNIYCITYPDTHTVPKVGTCGATIVPQLFY